MPPNIQWMNRGFTKIQKAAIQLLKWRLKKVVGKRSEVKQEQTEKEFCGW